MNNRTRRPAEDTLADEKGMFMSRYGSIGEFRAALNSLVNGGESSAFRNPRARRNMAWPKAVITPDGTSIPAADAGELKDLLSVFPGSRVMEVGGAILPPPAPAPATRDLPRMPGGYWDDLGKGGASSRRTTAPRKRSLMEDVQEDFRFHGPYRTAALLLGGQSRFCPTLRAQAKKKGVTLSSQKALRSMGLEPDLLFQFLKTVAAAHPEAFTTKHKGDGTPYAAVIGAEAVTPQVIAASHRILNAMGITIEQGPGPTGHSALDNGRRSCRQNRGRGILLDQTGHVRGR